MGSNSKDAGILLEGIPRKLGYFKGVWILTIQDLRDIFILTVSALLSYLNDEANALSRTQQAIEDRHERWSGKAKFGEEAEFTWRK